MRIRAHRFTTDRDSWVARALVLCAIPALVVASCGGGGAGPSEPEDPELPPPEGIQLDPATGFYFGSYEWAEWRPGTLPVVLSAPHGGDIEPEVIPDRSGSGIVTVRDSRTIETTEAAAAALEDLTGERPHVVILHLRRTKLDANRALPEAALGDPNAGRAWAEYHALIDSAKARVIADNGAGLYLDMHGHGHRVQRLELGYLLNSTELETRDDATLDAQDGFDTSMRALGERTTEPFSAILRGPESFGGLLEPQAIPSVPSPRWPDPQVDTPDGRESFFSGGYSTQRHGSLNGGTIDGIQIEHNFSGIRDTAGNRASYAEELAEVVKLWIDRWYPGG